MVARCRFPEALRLPHTSTNLRTLRRGVALLTMGGYYFDVDLQVMTDFRDVLPADTEFATCHQATALHSSWEDGRQRWRSRIGSEAGSGLFQAFIAVTPGHALMRNYLRRLSLHYSGKMPIRGPGGGDPRDKDEGLETQLGVYALGEVFSQWRRRTDTSNATNATDGGEGGDGGGEKKKKKAGATDQTFRSSHGVSKVHMFVEVNMLDHRHIPEIAAVPPQRGIGSLCNYVVFDEDTARPVAYSRIVGAHRYCVDPIMNKPKSQLKITISDSKAAAAVKMPRCEDLPSRAIQLGIACT